jgi:phosphoribosylaminoimidazole-succinocarboxamide synthase
MVNDYHILALGWASTADIEAMKALTFKVNGVLKPLFAQAGLTLVDYKLEFGREAAKPQAPLLLGDEFTPDGCRLWDSSSQEKMDKDRFRRDLGNVIEAYREVGRRIGVPL